MAKSKDRRPADHSDTFRAMRKKNPRAFSRQMALLYINERNRLLGIYRPGWLARKEARRGEK